jgi:hypothetical protein
MNTLAWAADSACFMYTCWAGSGYPSTDDNDDDGSDDDDDDDDDDDARDFGEVCFFEGICMSAFVNMSTAAGGRLRDELVARADAEIDAEMDADVYAGVDAGVDVSIVSRTDMLPKCSWILLLVFAVASSSSSSSSPSRSRFRRG